MVNSFWVDVKESMSIFVDNSTKWTPVDRRVSTIGSIFGIIVQRRRGNIVVSDDVEYPGLVWQEIPRFCGGREPKPKSDKIRLVGKIYLLRYSWNIIRWISNSTIWMVGATYLPEDEFLGRRAWSVEFETNPSIAKGKQQRFKSCQCVDRQYFGRHHYWICCRHSQILQRRRKRIF